MKTNSKKFLLVLFILPFLAQCASQGDVNELRYQLQVINRKLEEMRSDTVGPLQKRQAAASGQMDTLEQDLLQLKSQLDENAHLNHRLKEQNKELKESINNVARQEAESRQKALEQLEQSQRQKEAEIAELNAKLSQQEKHVKAIQRARIKEAERKAKEAELAAKLAKTRKQSAAKSLNSKKKLTYLKRNYKKVKKSVVAPARPVPSYTSKKPIPTTKKPTVSTNNKPNSIKKATQLSTESPATLLTKAKQLYSNKKYSQARKLFQQIEKSSDSNHVAEARFMIGETYLKEKQYNNAFTKYQEVIARHSGDKNAPKAMLQQANIAENYINDKAMLNHLYKKLIQNYGSSPEATIARDKLKKL